MVSRSHKQSSRYSPGNIAERTHNSKPPYEPDHFPRAFLMPWARTPFKAGSEATTVVKRKLRQRFRHRLCESHLWTLIIGGKSSVALEGALNEYAHGFVTIPRAPWAIQSGNINYTLWAMPSLSFHQKGFAVLISPNSDCHDWWACFFYCNKRIQKMLGSWEKYNRVMDFQWWIIISSKAIAGLRVAMDAEGDLFQSLSKATNAPWRIFTNTT